MRLSNIALSVSAQYGGLFSPSSLFTSGVNGAWYDPTALTTLYQDAAGTLPVTAVEQPVGLMKDKSGRGNHAFNSSGNSANFPVLKEDATGLKYLSFNGTNQWLQTNSIDFSYGDKLFICAGVRKLSDAAAGAVAEISANWGLNSGAFAMLSPGGTVLTGFGFRSNGTTTSTVDAQPYASPTTNVVSGIGDISGDQAILRVNGTQAASSTADQGTGNYGNYPLYIGARAGTSLFFNGRLYCLVVAGKQASSIEISNTEAYLNQKTGAY